MANKPARIQSDQPNLPAVQHDGGGALGSVIDRAARLQAPAVAKYVASLRVDHPDETPAQITSQIVTQRGKRMLYIEQASFSPVYPLVYAAAGTMQDGLFTPVSTDCRPKLPLSLPIGDIQSPIAQISDAMGHTAFFDIEP